MNKFILLAVAATATSSAMAHDSDPRYHGEKDFGEKVAQLAKDQAEALFGIRGTLGESSTTSLSAAAADANPARLLTVAPGLRVRVVSAAANLGPNIDQMVLWPNATSPTHIIACNEQGAGQVAVQRIKISTGAAENIISSGLQSCDPARLTPWGTIVVGEENGVNGRLFEILDPLHTTNVTITGAGASTVSSDPVHVAPRPALGQFAFEGVGILPTGVVYLTDENRPGTGGIGNPGGALVKFIPTSLWTPGSPPITSLAQSPWLSGSIYGMRVGRNGGNTDVGQGNEFGRGVWVEVTGAAPINLRAAAAALKLTSYYRPEDMSVDPQALAKGNVRFCGTNTGQDVPQTSSDGDNHWGEVYCVTDGTITAASSINVTNGINTASIPEYQPLIIGNPDFAMPDNIDIQPGTGNFLVNEDGEGPIYPSPRNNDIWDCLDDGDDADQLSDACVKVMTLNDLTAESTGGVFDGSGTRYFVSIQHNITGHGVILEVDGWRQDWH